jgi:hypothetical protein
MKSAIALSALLAVSTSAFAAPNVTNATQKGSLLVFPDIDVSGTAANGASTLVRLMNDGSLPVTVKCYWMDGNKNRVDFEILLTKNQPVWFDARTGNGTYQVNPFPMTPSNGFDNPYLLGPFPPPWVTPYSEDLDTDGPYGKGLLVCFAVDPAGHQQIKWNHLSGTATVYETYSGSGGAYEYNAYAFFAPGSADMEPVGTPGTLALNGVEYDSCPLYQIGQFSPESRENGGAPIMAHRLFVEDNRLAIVACTLQLQQDWIPVFTKLAFDVWNNDEVKFTGAFECADSWHETFFEEDLDAAIQNFDAETLGTPSARYRVQGTKSTQCPDSQSVGVLAVQSSELRISDAQNSNNDRVYTLLKEAHVGTTLASAGKTNGVITWDPQIDVTPEGGVRDR